MYSGSLLSAQGSVRQMLKRQVGGGGGVLVSGTVHTTVLSRSFSGAITKPAVTVVLVVHYLRLSATLH